MSQPRPSFLDSPYFVDEYGNWHLKDDAPEELKKEFEAYMKDGDPSGKTYKVHHE